VRCLIWGLGASGKSALELLKSKGYEVMAGDDAEGDKIEDFINEVDLIVVSPGIPPSHKLFKLAKEKEIPIIGELELAYRFFNGKIIAITGTDGKSTTTRLTYNIFKKYFKEVEEGGNIGRPFSYIVKKNSNCIAVLEVSSFQAKTIVNFKPDIAVFTNFSEDHLDWHESLEDYLESKYRLFKNQSKKDIAVLNKNFKEVEQTPTRARKIFFNDKRYAHFEKGYIYIDGKKFINTENLKIIGRHNIDNIMASVLTALSFGIPEDIIREEVYKFEGLPFRLSFVKEYRGVRIYNDSKATTINALMSALKTFPDRRVILIAGGILKSYDAEKASPLISKKLKLGLVYGKSKSLLYDSWKNHADIKMVSNLEEAVKVAIKSARKGDIILFSPACSSFDMFSNYIERGKAFNEIVSRFTSGDPSPS